MTAFMPGDQVKADDGRTGSVVWADYGGVTVQLARTDVEGAERRVYRESQLQPITKEQ